MMCSLTGLRKLYLQSMFKTICTKLMSMAWVNLIEAGIDKIAEANFSTT